MLAFQPTAMPPSWTSHSENIAQAAAASSSSSTRRIPSIDLKGKAAQPKLPPSIVAAIADAKKKEEALQKAKEEHERALVLPKGNFKLFGDTRRIDGDGVDGVPSDPRLKSSTSLDFGEKHRQKSKVPVARLGKLVGFQVPFPLFFCKKCMPNIRLRSRRDDSGTSGV